MMALRFSLWSLLATLTFLAAVITCFVLGNRIRQLEQYLRAEQQRNQRLEVQLGAVLPGDPHKIQILNLEQLDAFHWKWRMRLPADSDYLLVFRHGPINDGDVERRDGTVPLRRSPDDTELVDVEMRVSRERNGEWHTTARFHKNSTSAPIPAPLTELLSSQNNAFHWQVAGAEKTEEFSGEQPIPLLQLFQIPALGKTPPKPTGPNAPPAAATPEQGAQLWLVRQRR